MTIDLKDLTTWIRKLTSDNTGITYCMVYMQKIKIDVLRLKYCWISICCVCMVSSAWPRKLVSVITCNAWRGFFFICRWVVFWWLVVMVWAETKWVNLGIFGIDKLHLQCTFIQSALKIVNEFKFPHCYKWSINQSLYSTFHTS